MYSWSNGLILTTKMTDRNLFRDLGQQNLADDYDDGQSDISVDELGSNSDLDMDYSVELATDTSGSDSDDGGPSTSGVTSRPRVDSGPNNAGDANADGWSFDCSSAGSNVSEFDQPTGPNFDIGLDPEPIEFFSRLIPDSFFELLCEQTNLYMLIKESKRRILTGHWKIPNGK